MRLKECGWDEEVKLLCRKAVMEDGNEDVDSVVQRVTPTARTLIPDVVKEELLVKIKILLQEQKRKETHRKKDEFKKRDDMKKKEEPKKMSK
ncbi:hypothetical protein ZHAS_00018022 [Anopheles sinensis]|uniref:Enhancer of yellow 2 transcription factor n=1 Tax=Anopheles sinensis TaxID=74873 RepID=A0A084WID9_ANOSI|nr:hypothetical protein ZHAS_00018022 [Anopheles sinensis]